MTDIDEILRQLKESGSQMMNLELTGLKVGDVEIDKMIVDPQKKVIVKQPQTSLIRLEVSTAIHPRNSA